MTGTMFGGVRLLTAPGEVMTPRLATEGLVDAAAELLGGRAALVADVGTGSGAIAVALAFRAAGARIWATDSSDAAVALARKNVSRHGLDARVSVHRADLLEGVPTGLDLVVANLPYLAEALRPDRQELAGEPDDAVFAPGDGLGLYRRLIVAAGEKLRPDGVLAIQLHRRVIVRHADELPGLDLAA